MASDDRNAIGDAWYQENRREVESFFVDRNHDPAEDEEHISPSGRYRLRVQTYCTKPESWRFSRGLLCAGDKLIADVKRNYDCFFFGWAENWNGHDYLLCGEDYQGQTVIEADTGRRIDYISEYARPGSAFCCAAYYASPDRKMIVIDGCYWACPYELVFCRVDDPMTLPWLQFERMDFTGTAEGWTKDGFIYELSDDIRITDGKAFEDLTDVEQEEYWARLKEIGGVRHRRFIRVDSGEKRLLDERIAPSR
jgi:hypothetical protein